MGMPFPAIYLNLQLNGENLVSKLAHEHYCAELTSLLSKEAGSKKDAAYGFAWGGHDSELTVLLLEDTNLVPFAVAGYCRGGFNDKAQFLIRNHPDKEEKNKEQAVYGNAQAGNRAQVLGALRSSPKYRLKAILGAASTNQKDLLMELLQGSKFYTQAIQEAAKNGQFTLVQDLIKELGIEYHKNNPMTSQKSVERITFLNAALTGCIEGSHFGEAGHLISLGANPSYAVQKLCINNVIKKEEAEILLAHIHEEVLRTKVMSIILTTDLGLDPDSFDTEEMKRINAVIKKGSHYFAAQKAFNGLSNPQGTDLESSITLCMLEKIVMQNQEDNLEHGNFSISR